MGSQFLPFVTPNLRSTCIMRIQLSFALAAWLSFLALSKANDDITTADGSQLSLRNCRQSSDYAGQARCTGAIDGNTDQRFSMTTMSTTGYDAQPWWEAQTEVETEFTKVRIYNRGDCCPERLNNFVIKVNGQICAEYNSATAFSVKTFPCHKKGRILRIESRIQTHLTMAEVQVFGFAPTPATVAPQLRLSNCHQSSDYGGRGRCTGAIDGTTAQTWSYEGVSTTNNDPRPWWEAQTDVRSKIKQVRIYNRQDCCPERLNNFVIKVDDEICAEYNSNAAFSVWTFDCDRVGKTVRIESRVSTFLTLAEVQVLGEPSAEPRELVQLSLKNCRQSSEYAQSRCTGAIDGNTDQRFSITTMSTTNNDAQPWWETQVEQVTEFAKVRIFNRQDCCPERLNNFVIKVDGEICAEYNSGTAFSVQSFECHREGRVLRIESRIQTHISLAEVQVFGYLKHPSDPTTQLRLSHCRQSSTYAGKSHCTGAIDGTTSQVFTFEGMSTTDMDALPWWEAQTDAPSKISQVRIYNRQDCCPERLSNFVIKVDDEVCAEYNSGAPFSVWTFDCNRVGKVIRIQSRISTHLTLAEVQVFGHLNAIPRAEPEPVLLKLKNCRQSSDYGQSRCTGAIDGNTDQRFSMTTMSTTNEDDVPWWEAQTERMTEFSKVRIYNRQDCCPERLNNFVIKVDGQICAEYNSATAFSIETFKCSKAGTVIRIESRKKVHLTMAEVEVFGFYLGPKSLEAPLHLSNCSQSSDYGGRSRCTGAIDGNTDQTFSFETMSTTNVDANPWWQARTDVPSKITQVRIYNRQDCCPERLGNFVIKVDGEVCAEYTSGASFSIWTFDCNRIGSTVRIESKISTHLTMAEVQVFGEPAVKECFRQQEIFVGSTSVTTSGKPCQAWSVKSCPEDQKGVSCHVPRSEITEAGLTGNTCRNPSEYMRDRPWCYTTTAQRWEYCNIAEC